MTTVAEVVDDIIETFEGTFGTNEIDLLDEDVDTTETRINVYEGSRGIRPGSIIEVDDELMRVIKMNVPTVTVVRGYHGTTAATHTSGTMVNVTPRFSRNAIMKAMHDEIEAWPVDVFQVDEIEVTVNPSNNTMLFEILDAAEAENFLWGLEVLKSNPASTSQRYDVDRQARIIKSDAFTSTLALQLARKHTGWTEYRVRYAKKFDLSTWASTTDLTTDVGIPSTMLDIVRYGAMGRVLVGKEAKRVSRQRQGQSRNPQEVREGASFQTAAAYTGIARQRLAEEKQRLMSLYPRRV